MVAAVAHAFRATADGHARRATVYKEGGDRIALAAVVLVGVGDGEDDGEIGVAGVADEVLAAVDDKVIALAHGAGLDRVGIGTGTRFGEGKAVGFLALHTRQQVVVDLLVLAGHEDFRRPCNEDMQRPGHLGQLTFDQRLGQVVQTAPSHFLGHVEGIEASSDGFATDLRGQFG
ncbi:hypothetical protein D9M71_387180 [compost metagenome]